MNSLTLIATLGLIFLIVTAVVIGMSIESEGQHRVRQAAAEERRRLNIERRKFDQDRRRIADERRRLQRERARLEQTRGSVNCDSCPYRKPRST